MTRKQYFKIGFIQALADHGVTPDDFVAGIEKQAVDIGSGYAVAALGKQVAGGSVGFLPDLLYGLPSRLGSRAAGLPESLHMFNPFKTRIEEAEASDLIKAYNQAAREIKKKIKRLKRELEKKRERKAKKPVVERAIDEDKLDTAQQLYEQAVRS